jgi:hypothetical protein
MLPNVGGLLGANTVITDPDFNNPIVRVSDVSLNPANRNISITMSTGGSGDENMWNSDSTLFTIGDTGSNAYPMTFDPVTMQAARMYLSNFPATGGLKLANSGSWSFADSNVLFTFDNQLIHRYDFTDRSNPPTNGSNPNCGQAGSGTLCTFYDFTSSPNCLSAGYKVTWLSEGGQSKFPPDQIFAAGFSNAGGQNTGFNIAAYKVGGGCSSLNTKTGVVTGDWGATGNVGISDQFTIHNVKISRDGNWLVVTQAANGCLTTCNTTGVYFWQIGTTNLVSCISRCTGHWTEGTNHFVNGNGTPFGERAIRAFAAADNVTLLIPADCPSCFPAGYTPPNDAHIGWSNADQNDTTPFGQIGQSTTYDGLSKLFPSAWYNEVQAIAVDGSGKVWRFAHTFTSAKSLRFDVAESIGSISQDGRFFMWTSDWMGTLGSENGSSQCTLGGTNGGTGCRGDVFVVKMQ